MTNKPQVAPQPLQIPDRETIRRELADTRAQFHALLSSLTDVGFRGPTATKWNAGELLMHLITTYERMPKEISRARVGKGMWNLPLPCWMASVM